AVVLRRKGREREGRIQPEHWLRNAQETIRQRPDQGLVSSRDQRQLGRVVGLYQGLGQPYLPPEEVRQVAGKGQGIRLLHQAQHALGYRLAGTERGHPGWHRANTRLTVHSSRSRFAARPTQAAAIREMS